MRKIVYILLAISVLGFGQMKDKQIIGIMEIYKDSFDSPYFDKQFVHQKLQPALASLEQKVCRTGDRMLFQSLLLLLKETQGCKEISPKETFAGLYVCRPKLIRQCLRNRTESKSLLFALDLGWYHRLKHQMMSTKKTRHIGKRLEQLFETYQYRPYYFKNN
ncbi:MAG: hypothetical protein OIF50_12050 [Flavobacteriaceae bacterium]|nr:hypothetical protein [Flavobacteriaceae bacterium]